MKKIKHTNLIINPPVGGQGCIFPVPIARDCTGHSLSPLKPTYYENLKTKQTQTETKCTKLCHYLFSCYICSMSYSIIPIHYGRLSTHR